VEIKAYWFRGLNDGMVEATAECEQRSIGDGQFVYRFNPSARLAASLSVAIRVSQAPLGWRLHISRGSQCRASVLDGLIDAVAESKRVFPNQRICIEVRLRPTA
jgi:hypothetical protein